MKEESNNNNHNIEAAITQRTAHTLNGKHTKNRRNEISLNEKNTEKERNDTTRFMLQAFRKCVIIATAAAAATLVMVRGALAT